MTSPQAVAAAAKRLLDTPGWEWRHTLPDAPAERRAAEILRDDVRRARRWIEHATGEMGMPMPVGNGTNGPWNRLAVVRESDGRLGVLDIAAGRLAVTDTPVPKYVRRFVMANTASSPHLAGGSGACPSGWGQVALTYYMRDDDKPPVIRFASPKVTWVIWGLRTCYGTCGDAPTGDDYRDTWAKLAQEKVPMSETDDSQWEEIPFGSGVDPELWSQYLRYRQAQPIGRVRTRKGHSTLRGVRLHYVELLGFGEERRAKIACIREDYIRWAEDRCRQEALAAIEAMRDRLGLGILTTDGGLRLNTPRSGNHNATGPDHYDRTLQRGVLRAITPPPHEQGEELQERADDFLRRDAMEIAREAYEQRGVHGANHISYVVNLSGLDYREFLEIPGVGAHYRAVREAIKTLGSAQ